MVKDAQHQEVHTHLRRILNSSTQVTHMQVDLDVSVQQDVYILQINMYLTEFHLQVLESPAIVHQHVVQTL